VFSLDETRILTWSADGTARVWDLQADYDFSRELLILRLEVQTGTRLTDVGDLEALSPEEWWEEKRQYEEIDREHLKTGNYPRANLFLNYLMKCPGSCDRPGEWLQEVNPDVVSEAAFKYARICLNRGSFYLNLKKYDQAVRAFETSRQLLTTHPSKSQRSLAEAYERSGRTFIESGQDVEKGIEYVRKSLELSPYQEPELAPETLALGYIAQEQYAEAVAWLEEQLKQFPDNKTLLQCLEEAKEGLGE
jgi:tetratricopeptide (TPR) repeat protein